MDAHVTIEELFEAVFSVRSVPKLYKENRDAVERRLDTDKAKPIHKRQTHPIVRQDVT
jgi:hypothetical protein